MFQVRRAGGEDLVVDEGGFSTENGEILQHERRIVRRELLLTLKKGGEGVGNLSVGEDKRDGA